MKYANFLKGFVILGCVLFAFVCYEKRKANENQLPEYCTVKGSVKGLKDGTKLAADAVIVAAGFRCDNSLYQAMQDAGVNRHIADRYVRRICEELPEDLKVEFLVRDAELT